MLILLMAYLIWDFTPLFLVRVVIIMLAAQFRMGLRVLKHLQTEERVQNEAREARRDRALRTLQGIAAAAALGGVAASAAGGSAAGGAGGAGTGSSSYTTGRSWQEHFILGDGYMDDAPTAPTAEQDRGELDEGAQEYEESEEDEDDLEAQRESETTPMVRSSSS
jgi:hypothetical protein